MQQGHDPRIRIVRGDITEETVDAIVNAANERLEPGGGVDGALNRAAGPQLADAMRAQGGCPPGEARTTPAYGLPAQHVIHAVGPVWRGGDRDEEITLARCYRNIFAAATKVGARTIAIPAIATGAYGFPVRRAAHVALHETHVALDNGAKLDEVRFVCFDEDTAHAYESELQAELETPEV